MEEQLVLNDDEIILEDQNNKNENKEKIIYVQSTTIRNGGIAYFCLSVIAFVLAVRCNRTKDMGGKMLSLVFATICPVFYIFYKLFDKNCVGDYPNDHSSYIGNESIFIIPSKSGFY